MGWRWLSLLSLHQSVVLSVKQSSVVLFETIVLVVVVLIVLYKKSTGNSERSI